jgi:hypothetical protein
MYIYSSGSFYNSVESDELLNLKEEVKVSCGAHIRRIDRFIQLSLIGAHRCAKGITLAENTGLYVASSQGAKGNISKALVQIYKDKQPLMPLNFINMVGNAASFYIAKTLNIQGVNLFLTRNHFTFEAALEIAMLDISTGTSDAALVGSVDECITPLSHHRSQLRIPNDAALGEGSHWWLIGNENAKLGKPLAIINDMQNFTNTESLHNYINNIITLQSDKKLHISLGLHLNESDKNSLYAINQYIETDDYTKKIGFYESSGGYALSNAIKADYFTTDTIFMHIDKNKHDVRCCTVLERPK